MNRKYRFFVLGSIPPDLKERVIAIHVAGILRGDSDPTLSRAIVIQNGENLPNLIMGKSEIGNEQSQGFNPVIHKELSPLNSSSIRPS